MFKIGDTVVRKQEYQEVNSWSFGSREFVIENIRLGVLDLKDGGRGWGSSKFEPAGRVATITREQFKQVYDLVCDDWKKQLIKEYPDFAVDDSLKISIDEINNLINNDSDKARVSQIRGILGIEEDFKVGDLVLSFQGKTWCFRFYAGLGRCYDGFSRSGSSHKADKIVKYDPNNLPAELK